MLNHEVTIILVVWFEGYGSYTITSTVNTVMTQKEINRISRIYYL
jgi:hypothetical protein